MGLYPIVITDVYAQNNFDARALKASGVRGAIIKAGQGGYLSLPTEFVKQCQEVGLPYGFYWVIDSRYNSEYHMNVIKNTFTTKDFGQLGFWFDCEKPVITMSDADYWRTAYAGQTLIVEMVDKFITWSGKTCGIYTGMGFIKLINLTKANAEYLSKLPLWTAQYNNSLTKPDLYGAWSDWTFWQYRESPDMNYFNGSEEQFTEMFNLTSPAPTPDVPNVVEEKQFYIGMNYKKYNILKPYGNTVYHVMEISKENIEKIFVTPKRRNYVPRLANEYDMHFMINGDGFNSYTTAGFGASDGVGYYGFDSESTIYIDKSNKITMLPSKELWNAISYPNTLVLNGSIPTINKDPNDVRARTCWGWNKDQSKLYFMWVDGKDYFSKVGLNFQDCAKIMLDMGCYNAVMQDGGGSTTATVKVDGKVQILGTPSGEDLIPDFPGYMLRPVANAIGVRMSTSPTTTIPPQGNGETTMQYIVKTAVKPRKTASMYEVTTLDALPVGTIFDALETYHLSHPGFVDDNTDWVKHSRSGYWLPLIYKGVEYVKQYVSSQAKATAVVTLPDGTVINLVQA